MMKTTQIKKNHHYVWAFYLRNWSKDGKNIWYTTKSGKVSHDSVKGFPKEDLFYKMGPITQQNINHINSLFHSCHPLLKAQHQNILNKFVRIKTMEDASNSHDNYAARHAIEALKSNALEDLHCFHENSVKDIMKYLAQGEISYLSDPTNLSKFIIFFGYQITRTKSFRDIIIAISAKKIEQDNTVGNFYKASKENWWLTSYLIGMNIGHSLNLSISTDLHCILINETNTPFITSDQPIINVHPSINKNSVQAPEDDICDLYYPISPKVAYMINRSNSFPQGISNPTEAEVDRLNTLMAMETDMYLMGNEKEVVERYKKYIGFRKNIIKNAHLE